MRIEYFCFVAAALAALGGMGLGLYMGLAHDFTLAPASPLRSRGHTALPRGDKHSDRDR